MQKAADAFRTISEVADDLSLPQHVLRFWETRFPQIRPLKRAGGRRYYRPADVTVLRTIRQLLYDDGYTIKGVQRLLKEQGPRGLGAGPRAADADIDPTPEVDVVDAPDIGDASAELLADLRAATEGKEHPGDDYRGVLKEALSIVEECRLLLETVLRKH